MLEYLHLTNVGPAPEMEMRLAPRLNLITGDNGLGKSFLLDVAWWALTRRWPADVNPRVGSGLPARPSESGSAAIAFSFQSKVNKETYRSQYDRRAQAWTGRPGRPPNPGLVLYAQVDGGFAVWDPARNYWKTTPSADIQERQPAYVFSAREVWDGLDVGDTRLCNGLLADWALWQKERGDAFRSLTSVLAALSESPDSKLEPGELTTLRIGDARWMPTLRMPYGVDVPIVTASAAMKRITALAYLLVWSWQEHLRASKLLDETPTRQITFLIDELESHLHPRWQRTIVRALLGVMKTLAGEADVQLVAVTHSPLLLASVEPLFDDELDAWFDLDLVADGKPHVQLNKRDFVRRGTAGRWLTSPAFDLASEGRSVEAEQAMSRAEALMRAVRAGTPPSRQEVDRVDAELRTLLSDVDRFWVRWSALREELGASG